MPLPTLGLEPVDLVDAHLEPARDEERRRLAGAGTTGLGALTLRVGDHAVTLTPGDEVAVRAGEDPNAPTVVEFRDAEAFTDFHGELRTVPGLAVTNAIRFLRGDFGSFDEWEPALRALYRGRPVFDPTAIDLDDASRSFHHDDPDDEIGPFLHRYGWAHVSDVFTADEIADIDGEVLRIEAASRPDTPDTWWTRDADGAERACQLHYLAERSERIAALDHDPRVRRLVDLLDPALVNHPDRMLGTFAVLKRTTATDGLTNLPWHVDCGLGGHPLTCPGLHIGIQLTPSNPRTGAFTVLPGSHRRGVRRSGPDADRWPTVTVDTRPGDVTLHVPDTLHAAPPPEGPDPGRRTLYLGFARPGLEEVIGPKQSFDDLITATSDDGHVGFTL